jgi:hypothetical protein
MEREIVDILRRLGMFLDPAMGAHIAHSMKMAQSHAIAGYDVAYQHPCFGWILSVAVTVPLILPLVKCPAEMTLFNGGKLAHDQCACGMYLAFHFPRCVWFVSRRL